MFCVISSCCLGTLAVLGHIVSGTVLVFGVLFIAALISTKYDFKLIKMDNKSFDWSAQLATENENDEFLPDDTESNMFVLERACDLSTLSLPVDDTIEEEHSDEWTSELMLPDSLLAELDDNSSNHDDEVEDLLPTVPPIKEKLSADIEFKRGHFKCDSSLSTSSSSSEESLSKGLQFPDMSAVDSANKKRAIEQGSAGAVLSKVCTAPSLMVMGTKLLPGFVTDMMQWSPDTENPQSEPLNLSTSSSARDVADTQLVPYSKNVTTTIKKVTDRRVVTSLDSSDESDFEIL